MVAETVKSFPRNSGYGLGRQIVQHAVNSLDLIDNAVRDLIKKSKFKRLDGSRHGIHRVDGTYYNGPAHLTGIVLDAD